MVPKEAEASTKAEICRPSFLLNASSVVEHFVVYPGSFMHFLIRCLK